MPGSQVTDTSPLGSVNTLPQRYSSGSTGGASLATTNGRVVQFQPSYLAKAHFIDAAAKVTNGISVSHTGAAAAGTRNMTLGGGLASGGIATLSPPRNVVITVTHASSIVAMSGVITGEDEYGRVITEAWAVTATGTSKTYTGKKAFKKVTQITEVVAADASANSIIAGSGDVLGLPFRLAMPTAVKELTDGAAPTDGTFVAGTGNSSTADWRGTFAPNQAPNGAKDFEVWYICDDPTDI